MRIKYKIVVNLKKCDLEWAKAMTRKTRDSLNYEYVSTIRLWEYKTPKKHESKKS